MCLYNMINLLISQQNGSLATVVNLTIQSEAWAIEWITYILPHCLQSTKTYITISRPRKKFIFIASYSYQFPSDTLATFIYPQTWHHGRIVWPPDSWNKHWLLTNLKHRKIAPLILCKIYPLSPSIYIPFLLTDLHTLWGFDKRSKHFPLSDHFIYCSCTFFSWLYIDIVKRKLAMTTLGT